MKIKDQLHTLLKGVLIVTAILLSYLNVQAQTFKAFARDYQLGLEGSFGIKTFNLSSNIEKINGLRVAEEGGQIGVGIGAKALRVKVRQGYFYSSSAVAHTVDEIRSAFVANLYPAKIFSNKGRFQPYFMGGIERNILRMYGTYGSDVDHRVNYSVTEAPYLGKISSIVASAGVGMEYSLKAPGYFISFFAEGRYGKPLSTSSSGALFSQTSTSSQMVVNVGVAFGYNR